MATTALARIAPASLVVGLIPRLLNTGFFIAIATASYFLIRKLANKIKRDSAISNYGENSKTGLAIAYADRLYSAMYSGPEWLSDWFGDGTDEDSIFQVALEMHNNQVDLALVSRQYQALYNKDLLTDITRELSSSEKTKWSKILSSGLQGVPLVDFLVVTKAPALILDGQLKPYSKAPGSLRLGLLVETLVFHQGATYHKFANAGQTWFVADTQVNLIKI